MGPSTSLMKPESGADGAFTPGRVTLLTIGKFALTAAIGFGAGAGFGMLNPPDSVCFHQLVDRIERTFTPPPASTPSP